MTYLIYCASWCSYFTIDMENGKEKYLGFGASCTTPLVNFITAFASLFTFVA